MGRLTILLLAALLGGCAAEEHEDIKHWMAESSKDLKGKVPPLPEIRAFPLVAYEGEDALDPFDPKKLEPARKTNSLVQPDLNRRREPLESFPLESLRMVGTLMKGPQVQALIQADKIVHQVRVGSYVGQNFGVVTRISEAEVALKELVQDGAGDWTERISTLQLQDQPQEKSR